MSQLDQNLKQEDKVDNEDSNSNRQVKQKYIIPSFLIKTYEILENPSLNNIMAWSNNGTSFVVKDQAQLCNNILPTYFKHKNYPSFLRQLNMYNFKKNRNELGETEFSHKWFRRGGKGLLSHVKRRNQEEEEEQGDVALKNLDEIETFRKQQKNLKSDIQGIQETQVKLQQALQMIVSQNESLQFESANLQKELVNVQKRNQSKFDSYSFILQEIVSKLQNEQADTNLVLQSMSQTQKNTDRKKLEFNQLFLMLNKEKRENDNIDKLKNFFVDPSQLEVLQRMQNMSNMNLGNLSIPHNIQSLWMNQQILPQLQKQPQYQLPYLSNSPYLLGSGMMNSGISPCPSLPIPMSPYMQSSIPQSSIPQSPHIPNVKNEQENDSKLENQNQFI